MKKIYRRPEFELKYLAADVITESINGLNQFDDCTDDIFM